MPEPVVGSILDDTKVMMDIEPEYTEFDRKLILLINSELAILTQVGVGDPSGFQITDATQTWENFTGGGADLNAVQTCVFLRVRLFFDPPQTSRLVEAYENQIREHEWRVNVVVDPGEEDV